MLRQEKERATELRMANQQVVAMAMAAIMIDHVSGDDLTG